MIEENISIKIEFYETLKNKKIILIFEISI